jgi:hypothetical protein
MSKKNIEVKPAETDHSDSQKPHINASIEQEAHQTPENSANLGSLKTGPITAENCPNFRLLLYPESPLYRPDLTSQEKYLIRLTMTREDLLEYKNRMKVGARERKIERMLIDDTFLFNERKKLIDCQPFVFSNLIIVKNIPDPKVLF